MGPENGKLKQVVTYFSLEKFQKPLTNQDDCSENCPVGGMAEHAESFEVKGGVEYPQDLLTLKYS